MLRSVKLRIIEPLLAGGYVVLLVIGYELNTRQGWTVVLALMAMLAFLAWTMSLRRARLIADTPTSRIFSAAQGYVEIAGQGLAHPQGMLKSHSGSLPCIWYRYVVERRTGNNKWRRIDSGTSTESFLVDDGSGRCLVDPDHAEVVSTHKRRWMTGDYRHTEWVLLPSDRIYAIGQFSTVGGAGSDLSLSRDVSELLAEWKANRPALLERFDLDGDGEIGEDEWLLARGQAQREVKQLHREIRTQPGTHILHMPHDGRLLLIANIDPEKLARRYRIWAVLHLAAFIGGVGGMAWVGINL
ncbi:MAG: hypothetical protein WDZ63_08950 [Burkholderiales bacterium]